MSALRSLSSPAIGTAGGSRRAAFSVVDPDSATGLYYVGAKYMDPELGRRLSMDSVSGKPSSPQSLDRYVYCVNNPLRFTDPIGERRGGGHRRAIFIAPPVATTPEAPVETAISLLESGEWRVYPVYAISSQIPFPWAPEFQVSLGAKFIGIMDPYNNVEPAKLFGVTVGYYVDVYVYTWLGTWSFTVGTPIAQVGVYLGPSPLLNPVFDVGIHLPTIEFGNGYVERIMALSEVDIPATMGVLKYIGMLRGYVGLVTVPISFTPA